MKVKDKIVGRIEQKDIDACMIPLIALYDHPESDLLSCRDHIPVPACIYEIPRCQLLYRPGHPEICRVRHNLAGQVYSAEQSR